MRSNAGVVERLAEFIDHVDVAVAVHGYGAEGYWTTLLLGGRNRRLGASCRRRRSAADRTARLRRWSTS